MNYKTIFLSSPSEGLEECREKVYKVIEGLDGYHCIRMEDFGSRDKNPLDFCLSKVKECDLFIGILGHLYGSCPEDNQESYTEKEYNEAVKSNKPQLMFLASDNFHVPQDLIESDQKREKQRRFREKVSKLFTRDTFDSCDDLVPKVVKAVWNWERKPTFTPVSSSEIIKMELNVIGDKYLPEQYIERPIDDIARKFLESQQKLLLIVDGAGTGKTSLCCHLTDYIPRERPIVFISCGHIDDVFEEITRQLVNQTGKDLAHSELNPVIILDAINEFENLSSMRSNLTLLLKQLSGIKAQCIITCRDVSWPYLDPQENTDFLRPFLYEGQKYGMESFSSDRLNKVIEGYFSHFGIVGEVSGSARSSMAHPLLLRFFCEAYSGYEVGRVRDVYSKELFETYLSRKRKDICHRLHLSAPNAVDEFLEALAGIFWDFEEMENSQMFANLPHGGRNPVHGSLYSSLLETQILVEREHPTTTRRTIFKYDEFQDFITARKFYRDIARENRTENPGPKVCAEYIAKLKSRPALETVAGFIFAISHDNSEHGGKEWRDVCDFGHLHSRAVIRALIQVPSKNFFPGEFELLLTLAESEYPNMLAIDYVVDRYAYLPENLQEQVKPWIEFGYPELTARIICDNFNSSTKTGWSAIWQLLKRDRSQISHRSLLGFAIDMVRTKEFSDELIKLLELLKKSADPEIRREAGTGLDIVKRREE